MVLMQKSFLIYLSKHVDESLRYLEMVLTTLRITMMPYGLSELFRLIQGATFWKQGLPRSLAVGCQKLYGSNKKRKKRYGYHTRSLSQSSMYRVKKLLGGKLSLRNYNAQVGETYAMIKALKKITGLGIPETRCAV